MNFDTDIRFLKGVGEKRAQQLNKLGIDTVGALLRFYPRAYEDWSKLSLIRECNPEETVCIKARIFTEIRENRIRQNMILYKFMVEDEEGSRMTITLFNNRFLAQRLHTGSTYLFYGKMGKNPFLPEMSSPEIAETTGAHIRPIYKASASVSSKALERYVKTALGSCASVEPIPEQIINEYKLCSLRFALENIHFPRDKESLKRARARLVFEELFVLQTALIGMKNKNAVLSGSVLNKDTSSDFFERLPFEPTAAQRRVTEECISDMMSGKVMHRLVQGDVGSGKTAVAAALCTVAADNGFQSALMAPTEILAEQHFNTLSSLLAGTEMRCVLLTGAMKKKQKDSNKALLKSGEAMIAVGTHALLTEDVVFDNLGLVITDEQHRFGVAQRARLSAKGQNPHTLVMSATPIPRTLGLILYGDLDISIIDEYPRGRQKIETYTVTSDYRKRVYNYIKKHLDEGRQGYIVCPLVEEGEQTDITSAEEYFKILSSDEFSCYKVGLLHGKMNSKDKEAVMQSFKEGEIQLLICTTVIEVGIDVPNAVIMLIENAERFGLSQLHQLRGRVGRGEHLSSCILISDGLASDTAERLRVIKENTDGFKIADEDLRLRGPGNFLGERQHGLPPLRIADLSADMRILSFARSSAEKILKADPALKKEEHKALRSEITAMKKALRKQ